MQHQISLKKIDYAGLAWSALAAASALTFAFAGNSILFLGFGIDSLLTAAADAVVLRARSLGRTSPLSAQTMLFVRRGLFAAGAFYFVAALYVLNESGSRLYYRDRAVVTALMLVFCLCALLAQAVLAILGGRALNRATGDCPAGLRRAAPRLWPAMLLCFFAATARWKGWWWSDAAAALLLVPLFLHQGWRLIERSKESAL